MFGLERVQKGGSRQQVASRFLVCLAFLWTGFSIPLRAAFALLNTGIHSSVQKWLLGYSGIVVDIFSDSIYVADILILMTTPQVLDGIVVDDKSTLRTLFKRSWKCWAFDVFPILLPADYFLWKSPLVHALARFNRLFKLPRVLDYVADWRLHSNQPNFLLFMQLATGVVQLGHWFGCAYVALSCSEGLGASPFVLQQEFAEWSFGQQYLAILFWGMKIVTGLSIETHEPEHPAEYLAIFFIAVLKMFVVAGLVGGVVGLVSNSNRSAEELRQRLRDVNIFLAGHRIPKRVRGRVREYITRLASRQGANEEEIMQLMPPSLRTDIAMEINGDLVRKVPLFRECRPGFIRELVVLLRPEVFAPGEVIIAENEVGREMFFINRGSVVVEVDKREIGRLQEGSFFGELAIISGTAQLRTATIRTDTYCDLSVLRQSDLASLLRTFSDQEAIIWANAARRIASNRLSADFSATLFLDHVPNDPQAVIDTLNRMSADGDDTNDAALSASALASSPACLRGTFDAGFIARFRGKFRPHLVEAGETLYFRDEAVDKIFFIADGIVQYSIVKSDPDNSGSEIDEANRVLLEEVAGACVKVLGGITSESQAIGSDTSRTILSEGSTTCPIFAGLVDFLLTRKYAYTVTAVSRCAVGVATRDEIAELIGLYARQPEINSDKNISVDKNQWEMLRSRIRRLRGVVQRPALHEIKRKNGARTAAITSDGGNGFDFAGWKQSFDALIQDTDGVELLTKRDKLLAIDIVGQLQDAALHALIYKKS